MVQKLTVVIVEAQLETAEIQKGNSTRVELLSSDNQEYATLPSNRSRGLRPDITYQLLLNMLDSPLNRAGMLKLYILTEAGVLLDIHPSLRVPRTYPQFAILMGQLLERGKIRSSGKLNVILGRTTTNVLKPGAESTEYNTVLPLGALRIGLEANMEEMVELQSYVGAMDPDKEYVFALGATSRSNIDDKATWVEKWVSVSKYPLSAAVVGNKLVGAFETLYGVV
ncbi:Ribosomal biogenesis, methyltransferase, EMG1/NEP1 [Carpediemonas membranifera]|uniref:Ribosomal biogenesis, methyltransferase, EMG1/NEP1 n=1 Tax=Carpediemonas membranifera TaxID=201153 RepID=A0A8J6B6R1_9EUKA|nr:Ribosomal biogenesis, methyltransferase, EMG1/NEP1 [Carpediemonas membranifera]|eukprot:KAG9393977.1 Ribosomal biogenesis, methyltransferase, EMG1/NEP1 [Carpediemonas membranifera]